MVRSSTDEFESIEMIKIEKLIQGIVKYGFDNWEALFSDSELSIDGSSGVESIDSMAFFLLQRSRLLNEGRLRKKLKVD